MELASASIIPRGIFVVAAGSMAFKLISSLLSRQSQSRGYTHHSSDRSIRFSVIGDSFADIMVGPLSKLPDWGKDTIVDNPIEIVAGGCALNVAVQMAALRGMPLKSGTDGTPVNFTFHSTVGADMFGEIILKRLLTAGVKPSFPEKQGNTPVCLVLTGTRDRGFASYKGVLDDYTVDKVNDREQLVNSSHVHVGGFYNCGSLHPGLGGLLKEVQAKGGTTSLTPQWDASEKWDGLDEIFPFIDVLVLNEDEAINISKTADHTEAVSYLTEKGVKLVVITLGKDGAIAGVKGEDKIYKGSCKKIQAVVDTTGAGDSFCAGFLYAWKLTGEVSCALEYGAACGAACVSKFGASVPPTHAELKELLKQR